MEEILPQDAIDNLLGAITGSSVEEVPVPESGKGWTPFALRRPRFLSSGCAVRLQGILESFIDSLNENSVNGTGFLFNREELSFEQLAYGEYVCSLTSPTLLSVVALEPLPGSMGIEIMPALVHALFDRSNGREIRRDVLLGGVSHEEARSLIEPLRGIAERFCRAWEGVAGLHPVLKSLHSNPRQPGLCHDGDMGLLVVLPVKLAWVEGIINLFLPRTSFFPLFHALACPVAVAEAAGCPLEIVFGVTEFRGVLPPGLTHGLEFDLEPLCGQDGGAPSVASDSTTKKGIVSTEEIDALLGAIAADDRQWVGEEAGLALDGRIVARGRVVLLGDRFGFVVHAPVPEEEDGFTAGQTGEGCFRGRAVIASGHVAPGALPELAEGTVIPLDTKIGERSLLRFDNGFSFQGEIVRHEHWCFRTLLTMEEITVVGLQDRIRAAALGGEEEL